MKLNTKDQVMFRSWNAQLGWSDTLYAQAPVYADPWPDTKIFRVKVTIIQEEEVVVDTSIYCDAA